jgi:DNA processing protein
LAQPWLHGADKLGMARPTLLLSSVPQLLRDGDLAWPERLRALRDPPSQLRVAGSLPALTGAVAVVGTRFADDQALEFAHELGAALASAGHAVISGGALGIDAAAHRGALDAGGCTVCVLATGFDRSYPLQHAPLFSEIARSGALVTEQDDGTPPLGWAFLARNRLIAALADILVVVQAPLRSGALSTAAVARKLGKPIYTVPYAPWEERGEGCVWLLRQGALICTSPRDVLSLRPHKAGRKPTAHARTGKKTLEISELEGSEMDPDSRLVWRSLGSRPLHPDELAATLGMHVMKVQHVLLQLLLLGLVTERGSGRYSKSL